MFFIWGNEKDGFKWHVPFALCPSPFPAWNTDTYRLSYLVITKQHTYKNDG